VYIGKERPIFIIFFTVKFINKLQKKLDLIGENNLHNVRRHVLHEFFICLFIFLLDADVIMTLCLLH